MTSTSWEVLTILPGWTFFLTHAHLADVDQALDARLQLDERAILSDVGDAALVLAVDRIALGRRGPRIGLELLHAQADALRLAVDADDLDAQHVADVEHFARVADALVAHVGDMQQAVDAAEVDEGAVVGDVLDRAVDDLALGEALDQAGALLGAALLEDRAARHDDVAALAVHLQDHERLRQVHQRGDVADRADIDLRTGQERHGAAEVDGEAALDPAEDDALDALAGGVLRLQRVPGGFAAGAVARQHRLAHGILDAVDEHFDFVADVQLGLHAGRCKLAERHAALRLQADIDDREVVLDGGDAALDHATFEGLILAERALEHRCEIVAGGLRRSRHKHSRPKSSRAAPCPSFHAVRAAPCERALVVPKDRSDQLVCLPVRRIAAETSAIAR